MKYSSQYHFYSRLVISIFIFALGFFILQKSVSTTAQVSPAKSIPITGWAWNEQIGWISLNCNNDFDGNGLPEDSCTGQGNYGLEVVSTTINGLLYTYVRGCAWAGNLAANDDIGWLCFSDPPGLATNAATEGVPVLQYDFSRQSSVCSMNQGYCNNNPTQTCRNFSDCGTDFETDWCIQPVLQGVCYDYAEPGDYPSHPRDIINYNPFDPAPRPDGWSYCYSNSECPHLGALASDECVYPQVNNRGICAAEVGGVISRSEQNCTFDDDCDDFSPGTEYCEIEVERDFIIGQTLCENDNDCNNGQGYTCTALPPTNYTAYPYALDYSEGANYATFLAIADANTLAGEDAVIFPIAKGLENSAIPTSEAYDPDNPDMTIAQSALNPINGCFNCYQEEIKRCEPNLNTPCSVLGANDPACRGTCNSITDTCSNNSNRACEDDADCQEQCIVTSLKNKCDNCLEYFFYNDNQVSRCDDGYQIKWCTSDADCDGVSCRAYQANKRCEAYDYFYCDINADCVSPGEDYGTCVTRDVGNLEKVLAGYNCSDCIIENLENSCTLNAYNKNINRCGTCEAFFKTPGVILDNHHNRLDPGRIVNGFPEMANLCGWAWNADYTQNNFGLGWINFSPLITTSSRPYFSVDKGNIYSQKNILSRYNPPFRKYNASYLIESGGRINNLVSSSTLSELFQGELSYRPVIDFLSANGGKYKNVLGTLDYNGLLTVASIKGGDNFNKFGAQIIELAAGDLTSIENTLASAPLNNKVFHVTSDLLIDESFSFRAGSGSNESAAGIIIIDGDLTIDSGAQALSILYENTSVDYLKNIASIVWIVKGDVTLSPYVADLAGTFVILGDGLNDCAILPPATQAAPSCGQFITGTMPNGADDRQLRVFGSVIARRFYLDRRFRNAQAEAAEKFINDGRLQSNPPLGLVDFSKAVPRFAN